ncbi:pilus assembly FimT family protein [Neptuniibacter caesariensis]|uniref:Prepilin-type N-terminal cleavage/methylation domain-containing protein n=1 Tax=Neptuniibacter caesariensis TaxID=207954 RepID=A0A7U8GSL6_NEPCE|nr:prepilin-type N-terminal cleavage/methylation domain-containing protein [Neptuniibacter caesariensis]EAR61210.1 hypothetical protein MED92_05129 [Oceanospirillum sp. MED92] [Neptuniibacter caesariensis]
MRLNSGFSLLELVVSILIISVLMTFGYIKLESMAEGIERVSFDGARNNIQAQLTIRVTEWYAKQQNVVAEELTGTNPVELIQLRPSNYRGELKLEELDEAPPEHWYFVTDNSWLVYKAKRIENLENEFEMENIIPFQIRIRFGQAEQTQGLAVGADLQALYAYKWTAD